MHVLLVEQLGWGGAKALTYFTAFFASIEEDENKTAPIWQHCGKLELHLVWTLCIFAFGQAMQQQPTSKSPRDDDPWIFTIREFASSQNTKPAALPAPTVAEPATAAAAAAVCAFLHPLEAAYTNKRQSHNKT